MILFNHTVMFAESSQNSSLFSLLFNGFVMGQYPDHIQTTFEIRNVPCISRSVHINTLTLGLCKWKVRSEKGKRNHRILMES